MVMAGRATSIEALPNGSILITSHNDSIGRDRWEQKLTIAYRNFDFVVAGYTYSSYDTLDLDNTINCDFNVLTGKGKLDDKPVAVAGAHDLPQGLERRKRPERLPGAVIASFLFCSLHNALLRGIFLSGSNLELGCMRAIEQLTAFILEAKAKTYVGGGMALALHRRRASRDIGHERGQWWYLDSYFGGTDFAGQEIVWNTGTPVWVMNYFGRTILPDLIDSDCAGTVIQAAFATMYRRRAAFSAECEYDHGYGLYVDESEGDARHFRGREVIFVDGQEAYELDYRGGLIRP